MAEQQLSEGTVLRLFDQLGSRIEENTQSTREFTNKLGELVAALNEQPKANKVYCELNTATDCIKRIHEDTGIIKSGLEILKRKASTLAIVITVVTTVLAGSYMFVQTSIDNRIKETLKIEMSNQEILKKEVLKDGCFKED